VTLTSLKKVVPCGRLDVESEGLILLTNDGSFNNVVTSPYFEMSKTYRVLIKAKRGVSWHENQSGSHLLDRGSCAVEDNSLCEGLEKLCDPCWQRDDVRTDRGMLDCVHDDMVRKEHMEFKRVLQFLEESERSAHAGGMSERSPSEEDTHMSADKYKLLDFDIFDADTDPHSPQCSTLRPSRSESATVTQSSRLAFALVDITLQEGKKREVRRLMSSIGFQTLMLIRISLGETIHQTVDKPNNLAEALNKCRTSWASFDYLCKNNFVSSNLPANTSFVKGELEASTAVMTPGSIRSLSKKEVDTIFDRAKDLHTKSAVV